MNNSPEQAKHRVRFEVKTCSARETARIGSNLGGLLSAGAVVLLTGELGVGKTVFAQGIAIGLEIDSAVTSPTYTLVAEYEGPSVRFYHLDLYRLAGQDPFQDIGAEEYLQTDGVTAIEWPESIRRSWYGEFIEVDIEHVGGDHRRLKIQGVGEMSNCVLETYRHKFLEPVGDG